MQKNFTRSEQRELAMALVFEKTFHEESAEELLEFSQSTLELSYDEYIVRTVKGVFEHAEQIDALIDQYCVGWRLDRVPRLPLCIMRIAVYELLYEQDIPTGVSINEAVELTKHFCGEDDYSFVNGVLGSVAKQLDK